MNPQGLEQTDIELIDRARETIDANYTPERHTVGAALRCRTGEIYTGVNVDSSGFGPCAEPVALGAAITSGHRDFVALVAVHGRDGSVLPPCGNCRQLLMDYAPDAMVVTPVAGQLVKVRVKELLPARYEKTE